jgi:aspartate aminotransferase-like enzyme
MEAAVSNLTSPADRILVLSAGKFGERWTSLGKAFGCQVDTVSAPYGQTFSIEEVRARLKPDVKAVFMQATETSTGARHCVQSIAALTKETDALLVVDAITGLGTTHFDVDGWGIDVIIGGSQKAVMIPPGLAYCAVSERAWKRMETSKNPRYYFDLRKERKSAAAGESAYTPAVALIAALGAALDYIAAGAGGDIAAGRDALIHNAEVVSEMTRAAVQGFGLKLFAPTAAAAAVTAVLAPEGTDSGKIVKGFKEQFGGVIANGQGEMKGQLFRIAHLGFFDYLDTIAMVGGLEHVLGPILGRNLLGVGLKAAQDVYAKRKGTTLAQLLEADQRCSCGRTSEECSSSLAVTA